MLDIVIEDYKLNSLQGFIILFRHRVLNKCRSKLLSSILKLIFHVLFVLFNLNCKISTNAIIGRKLKLLHQGDGVVISGQATIGDNVIIYHQVTVGVNERYKFTKKLAIEDNCVICSGAKIISCIVGEGVVVRPNAVVFNDVYQNIKVYKEQGTK